jgi:hypothetical protein
MDLPSKFHPSGRTEEIWHPELNFVEQQDRAFNNLKPGMSG